jgi:hypothetical protein
MPGITAVSLHEVLCAIELAKVLYCSPAWSGPCSVADFSRLDVFLIRCKRYSYSGNGLPSITQLVKEADVTFFKRSLCISEHVLQPFSKERSDICSRVRDRSRNKILIERTVNLIEKDFIIRMLIGIAICLIMKEVLVVLSIIPYCRIRF